jgi:polar amino acid transport system substrate-binding protein
LVLSLGLAAEAPMELSAEPAHLARESAPARHAIARAELAPTGTLRAAINLGNPVLARRDPASGLLTGASVDLARRLAGRLGVAVELVPFNAAGDVTGPAGLGRWDVAFLANEPERARALRFTGPYLAIDSTYMVRASGPFRAVSDLDRPGVRIAVAKGAAYDLYLSRTLRNAELVRAPTPAAALALFREGRADALAGIRQALDAGAVGQSDAMVLAGHFARTEQAIATQPGKPRAAAFVQAFLDDMVRIGTIRRALAANDQDSSVTSGCDGYRCKEER